MKTIKDELLNVYRELIKKCEGHLIRIGERNHLLHVQELESKLQSLLEKDKEPSDQDIEKWANACEHIEDEMPGTLKLHIQKKIECRIEGAKAMRDGKIY